MALTTIIKKLTKEETIKYILHNAGCKGLHSDDCYFFREYHSCNSNVVANSNEGIPYKVIVRKILLGEEINSCGE